jgi:hypothetical protein
MRTNSISQNHVELKIDGSTVCFSYGKPVVARVSMGYVINMDFYGYSVSTSKHVNSTFPELRGFKPDFSFPGWQTIDGITYIAVPDCSFTINTEDLS